MRRESLFSEPGVVEALELSHATLELNSAQRRPYVERTIAEYIGKPDDAATLLAGLEFIAAGEHTDNRELSTHARFLHSVLSEKLADRREPIGDTEVTVKDASVSAVPGESADQAAAMEFVGPEEVRNDDLLKFRVAELVSRGDRSDERIGQLGRQFYERYLSGLGVTEQIVNYGWVALAIDRAKRKSVGRGRSTAVSNAIANAVGEVMVSSMEPTNENIAIVQRVKEGAETGEVPQWLHAKYWIVENQLRQREQLVDYVARMARVERFFSMLEQPEEVPELARQAVEQIHEFRKYGVKPAYFRDGILHCSADSWVVDEPYVEGYEAESAPTLANIILAHAKDIDQIRGDRFTERHGRSAVIADALPYEIHFSSRMTPDGELELGMNNGTLPLRAEFQHLGAETVYELMRYSHIMRIVDLVVPHHLVEQLPAVPQKAGIIGRMRNLKKFADQNKLVVPRLRLLVEQPELVEAELEKEVRAAEEEAARRDLRKHGVVGHVRVLPKGYHPSPEARARAEQIGITLSSSETFVKHHERGNLEERIGSHLAVRR